jgi:hypothetical protein
MQDLVANRDGAITFFCGGERNFAKFIDLFDGVFVLDVDLATLNRWAPAAPGRRVRRKAGRAGVHCATAATRQDIPSIGTVIDASAPLARVVDEILRLSDASRPEAVGDGPGWLRAFPDHSSDTVRSCPRNATMAAFVRS